MSTLIDFKRINNDVNGNPRYVCHFLNFIKSSDDERIKQLQPYNTSKVSTTYQLALDRAKKIGGKKFHNKQYGGGIVFQSYNIQQTEKDILELMTDISAENELKTT